MTEAEKRDWARKQADGLLPILRSAHESRADPQMRGFAVLGPVPDIWHLIGTDDLPEGTDVSAWKLGVAVRAYGMLTQELCERLYDAGMQ
jgi:hypothetical protein